MKRIAAAFLVVLTLAAALGAAVQSQETGSLTVRDRSGAFLGRIDADGTFRDSSGASIGRFAQGVVRDRAGVSVGRVDADGRIRDRSGALMGSVGANGTLRDRSGVGVGRIDRDGTVRNPSGSLSGRFQRYEPVHSHAAAAYLFFFNPLHRR